MPPPGISGAGVYGSVQPRPRSEPGPPNPASSYQRTTPRGQAIARPSQDIDTPSVSMPKIVRPWALIIVILVIDLALAGTGAVLLMKGLADAPAKTSTTTNASVGVGVGDPGPPTPTPTPTPTPIAAAPPPPEPPPPDKHDAHHHARSPQSKLSPQDPYAATLENEVELQATRSAPALQQCAAQAASNGGLHGAIRISFQVQPDGRVSRVATLADSTGQPALATCLADTIARWSFAVHPTVARDFVRSFSY